jgi:hypothetical protein
LSIPRTRRPARRRARALGACALAAIAATACGKKGPPLPPFAKAPAVPAEVSVRRAGSNVEVRFTVPAGDVDGQRPAHIDRVEVWALTGPAVDADLFMKHATLVATVPVRRPPPPPPDVEEGKPAPPPPPPSTEPGLDQGQQGLAIDTLAPDELVPAVIPELEKRKAREEQARLRRLEELGTPRLTPPDLGPPLPTPPTRYYVVLGRNGGRKGAMTQRLPVSLTAAPPAPAQPLATVAESYLEVAWAAPAGLRQPVSRGTAQPLAPRAAAGASPLSAAGRPTAAAPVPAGAAPEAQPDEPPAPDEPPVPEPPAAAPAAAEASPPAETPGAPAGASGERLVLDSRTLTGFPNVSIGYHVYEVAPPHLTPAPLGPGEVPLLPRRRTTTPIAATTWRDEAVELGAERCYAIRTVETLGTRVIESDPSPVLCVSPTDTFPPKPPTSLAAVASEGAIGLIWDANTEPDLAGYIVLRGEAGGATMRPLMTTPITETTYRDTTTKAGVRYVYAVVAVDSASPQNVSSQSNRVEETAR